MTLSPTLTAIAISITLGFAAFGAAHFAADIGFMLAMAADGVGR